MNKLKFTKGEWQLPHLARIDTVCNCGYVFVGEEGKCIATIHEGGQMHNGEEYPEFEEAKANARLICAAPDLFNALIECRENLLRYIPNCAGDGSHNGNVLKRVEKAIKKVTDSREVKP